MIDDDEIRFPAGLLFEWQRNHERHIATQIGKAGAELRFRYEKRHLEQFGRLSYLAERIVIEKGDAWEYRLMTEVFRYEMAPILRRWNALKRGMYLKPTQRVDKMDFIPWMLARGDEAQNICQAFSELMNVEFQRALGEPGVAGSDIDIVNACRLFSEMCESALRWEEDVRFIKANSAFEEVHSLHVGVAGAMIDEAAKLPAFLSQSFGGEIQPGEYRLSLTLSLPDECAELVSAALAKATDELTAEHS